MVMVWQCQNPPNWFGSYRWFPSIRRLQSREGRATPTALETFLKTEIEKMGTHYQAGWDHSAVSPGALGRLPN
jgi:hypothetical protein